MNIITIELENVVGILDKLSNVLTRNRVTPTQFALDTEPGHSTGWVSISAEIGLKEAEKLIKQFQRIVEVKTIHLNSSKP